MAEDATPPLRMWRGYTWLGSVTFLTTLAVVLFLFFGKWWGFFLVFIEILYPYLKPAWDGLGASTDAMRAAVAPYKRFPGALVGIPLLFVGLALGVWAPETVQWLGDGVNGVVTFIADSAPLVIFFTLTPAIAGTLATGKAGKFALWVSVAYILATIAAGLLSILLVVPIFGVRWAGEGATGVTAPLERLGELAFTSGAFLAIFMAVGLGLMIHGLRLRGLFEATQFVGGKVIELLGDVLKILLPLILFALGVFIPTKIAAGINKAREGGTFQGSGWAGDLTPEFGYFVAIGVLVLILAAWILAFGLGVMRYTRLPISVFFRDYFLDVYSYAWSTSSSSASIPINLERTGNALRVRRQIREFIIPLGATVNLDGTMMGGIVTGVVAAQMVGYTPTVLDLLILLIPLTIITVGVPGIPGGLAAVAAPVMANLLPIPPGTEQTFTAIFIGFNIGLSDQFRTGVNTVSNGILARLFEHWYPTKFETTTQPARQSLLSRIYGGVKNLILLPVRGFRAGGRVMRRGLRGPGVAK